MEKWCVKLQRSSGSRRRTTCVVFDSCDPLVLSSPLGLEEPSGRLSTLTISFVSGIRTSSTSCVPEQPRRIAQPLFLVFDFHKHQCNAIRINEVPVRSFAQHRTQRGIDWNKCSIHSVSCQDLGPIGPDLPDTQSFQNEWGTVKIRPTIVEHRNRRPKAIDQIPTPLPTGV